MDDDGVIPQLQCDVHLEFTGPNAATLNKWAVDVLRRLADSIERNEFTDGHHLLKDTVGKTVGSLYIDYSGELI